jgi:hypothetical protein
MDPVEVLLEIPNGPRISEDRLQAARSRLRHHVRIAIDPQSLDVPFAQTLEKDARTASEIENARALLHDLEVRVMPSLQIVLLLGRTVKERKPLPAGRQRTKISVVQET